MLPLVVSDLPSPAACGTDELVEVLAAWGRAESVHAQRKVAVVAELYRRRCAEDAAAGAWTSQQGEFVPEEVGVALTVSKGVASGMVQVGLTLDTRLPATKAAFARGELDYPRVRLICERTDTVDQGLLAAVEAQILDKVLAPGRELTRTRLALVIDRIIVAADPDGATQRRERAQTHREVQIRPDADGMCSLWGVLTGVGGNTVDARLQEIALGVCGADPRTMAQRRADALTALALGADHLACTCGDPGCPYGPGTPPTPRVLIQVLIDAATLAGASSLPGVLSGFGIIDPALARALAADASWQQLLTDTAGTVTAAGPILGAGMVPPRGASAAGEGAVGGSDARQWCYRPSEKLARLVRARDGRCRFPGCGVPAARCDVDHIVAFNHDCPEAGGPTTAANLQCLCRRHHRLKTLGNWAAHRRSGAVMAWTSPTGTIHETTPAGSDLLNHLDPDIPVPGAPPTTPPQARYSDPADNDRSPTSDRFPDPWNGFDWHTLDDPMSPKEYDQLLNQMRFDPTPPDLEAIPEPHTPYRCHCPPF